MTWSASPECHPREVWDTFRRREDLAVKGWSFHGTLSWTTHTYSSWEREGNSRYPVPISLTCTPVRYQLRGHHLPCIRNQGSVDYNGYQARRSSDRPQLRLKPFASSNKNKTHVISLPQGPNFLSIRSKAQKCLEGWRRPSTVLKSM